MNPKMPETLLAAIRRYSSCPRTSGYEGKAVDAAWIADWAVEFAVPALRQIYAMAQQPSPQAIAKAAVEVLGEESNARKGNL